jgi:hypothetical protein
MSFLVTIHLDNGLRTHQRARRTTGAWRLRVKLCIGITLGVELRRYPDSTLGAKRHAEVAGLALFVVDDYFSLHNPTKIIKKNFNSKKPRASMHIFKDRSSPDSGTVQPEHVDDMKT